MIEDHDEDFDDDISKDQIEMVIRDGKLIKRPEYITCDLVEFNKLNSALKYLKGKYPEISKEIFDYGELHGEEESDKDNEVKEN